MKVLSTCTLFKKNLLGKFVAMIYSLPRQYKQGKPYDIY